MRTIRTGIVVTAAALVAVGSISVSGASVGAKKVKPTPGEVIASEEFAGPEPPAGWVVVEQEPSGAHIEDGAVLVRVSERTNGHRVFTTQPAPAPAGYAVEVDATLVSGDLNESSWGVTCRGTIDQEYSFQISPDGYYGIIREDADSDDRLDDPKDKAARKRARTAIKRKPRAVNRIRGECLPGGQLRMFVNGRFVAEATDPSPLPDGITWGFEPNLYESDEELLVSFDNFEQYDLSV